MAKVVHKPVFWIRIRIDLTLLYPNPYKGCGSGPAQIWLSSIWIHIGNANPDTHRFGSPVSGYVLGMRIRSRIDLVLLYPDPWGMWMRTCIDLALLCPDPYWEYGCGPNFRKKPGFQPYKKVIVLTQVILLPITYSRYIFHVKIQLLMKAQSDQDPDPHQFRIYIEEKEGSGSVQKLKRIHKTAKNCLKKG